MPAGRAATKAAISPRRAADLRLRIGARLGQARGEADGGAVEEGGHGHGPGGRQGLALAARRIQRGEAGPVGFRAHEEGRSQVDAAHGEAGGMELVADGAPMGGSAARSSMAAVRTSSTPRNGVPLRASAIWVGVKRSGSDPVL